MTLAFPNQVEFLVGFVSVLLGWDEVGLTLMQVDNMN